MKVSPLRPQTRSPRGVLHEGQGSCHRNFNNSCMSLQLRIRFKDGIAGSLGLGFRVRMNAKTLEECSWGWKFRNPPAQAERLFLTRRCVSLRSWAAFSFCMLLN